MIRGLIDAAIDAEEHRARASKRFQFPLCFAAGEEEETRFANGARHCGRSVLDGFHRMERRGPYMVRSGCWRVTPCCAAALYRAIFGLRVSRSNHIHGVSSQLYRAGESPRAIPISVIIRLAIGAHREIRHINGTAAPRSKSTRRGLLAIVFASQELHY